MAFWGGGSGPFSWFPTHYWDTAAFWVVVEFGELALTEWLPEDDPFRK
jgi:hypothetical protein